MGNGVKVSNEVKDEMRRTVKFVRDKMRITKITCTRSVRSRSGDVFVGFSAAWDTVEDESGHTADGEVASSGMTLKEAKVAAHLLGLQAEVTAFEHAVAGSVMRPHHGEGAIKGVRFNYSTLMSELLLKDAENGNGE